ncbi:PREDICTED: interferon regulatory factor 3-like isoform X1 [Poecilia mexicana]|uniref:interferon regulatory factor 3-like isoform X1 n=1 Tax=Poecilia mexicana TaxID=48701 RepID=UPI00072E8755|nr:PREDICTED: interferon regulatory factor 3-like isoform X1 [Poecilia mexicana]XP_014826695.1 PREDICTED: interferon regulatory factor 3-like isoform X1 [Poecilia mexicana]XP_014826696.1 PREDICTED: interferon regulatory factor 3-like isoform X1 [Poecilia mexicana]
MAHSKPLLIPWLKSSIDSKRYPGVHWTNPEQTEFCIPWKHALRQDSSNEDVLIFKAWAEVSGNGRAQGDPSVWKRNFRSALRAKGFKMVSDNKNDAANPHKVYRWPEESASGAPSSSRSQEQEDANVLNGYNPQGSGVVPFFTGPIYNPEDILIAAESPGSQDILQECLRGLNISPGAEGTTGFQPPTEQQQLQNQLVIGAHPLPGQQQDPVMFEGAARETGLPEQPARPAGGGAAEGGGYGDGQQAAQFLETVNQTRDGDHFKTHFRVAVFYRGVKVSEQEVPNEAGLRLVYRPDLNDAALDHETGLCIVSLPRPVGILDQIQASLTQRILDSLGSLDVGMSQHVIYGQRRGDVKAYWSFSKFDSSRQPREISKLNPEPLYQVKDFIRGLMDFFDGKESPASSMFFCLGEKWPDPENKPWEKKLIMVEVVPTSMELLKNAAVECGASSLRSVELQMSLEEMMDLY